MNPNNYQAQGWLVGYCCNEYSTLIKLLYCTINLFCNVSTFFSSCHSNDIPLQSLDARALLAKTTVSTPASSLDLEWEHEIVQPSMVPDTSGSSWTAFGDDNCSESSTRNTAPACNSESWSRISSANSLEWDSVHNSLNPSPPASEIDNDTQVLLNEIERLTSQTLQETGRDLIS